MELNLHSSCALTVCAEKYTVMLTDLRLYGAKPSLLTRAYGMYKEIYCNVADLRLHGAKSPFPMRPQDKHG